MRGLRNVLLCALLLGTLAQSSDDDCNCDILLILDRSGSLTANDWVLEKQFATTVVKGLAGNMPPQKVGVISFASNVRVDSPLTSDEDKLLAAIAASAKTNGATYMNLALDQAVKEFNANGTPGKCKTAKIITDGISTDPAKTKTSADALKAAGITLVAIGVGKANQQELNYLATDPDSKNAILLADFANLDQLAHSWVDKCAAANTTVGVATTVNMNNCDPNYKFSYPFATAVVPDTGRPVMQITADIEGGCKTGDVLALNPAVAGITATWSAADCELKLTGAADVTPFKWQTAVRNIRFTTTDVSAGPNIRTITWTMGAGLFWSVNGHYYEFIKVPKITWKDANTQAKGQTRYGMQCYMATVTSSAENAFLLTKLHGSGWIGATDELTEGTFRWVTGPEGKEDGGKGRIFWTGGVSGKAYNGQYENWGNGEPNDYKPIGGEDYAHFWERINGEWNDFPNYHGDIDGYFLECGDGSAAAVHYAETTKLAVFCNACRRDTTCSGKGVCLPDGTCDCFDQYAGTSCNTCAVNYINYPTCSHCLVVADKCSGKGCWDGTKCTCNAGFTGTNCDQCAAGFYGPNCVKCSPCYNGTCKAGKTGDGTCQCNTGFDPGTRCLDCLVPATGPGLWGPLCNKNCPADCGHGHCDDGVLGTGQCVCSGNYTQASGCKDCPAGSYGPMCLPCPAHKCYRHGKCNEGIAGDGKCTCDANFDPNTDCQLCMAGFTVITNSSAKLCPDHKDASGNTGSYDPKCACDVVFSLDKSLSISAAQWPLVVSFVKQMVYGMKFTDSKGMRVAVTSFAFATDSKKECPFAAVRADIIQCVDAIKRGTAGGTRTDLGFQYTLDFLKESEAATPGKCKAVYVVSDGAPYPTSVIPATNTLIKQIQSLPNTEVVAIGIGNVQMSMLQSWATAPIQDHAILLKDFDGLDHLAAMMSGQCPNGQDKLVEPNCHCDVVIVVDRSGSILPFWTQVVDFMYTLAYGYDMNSNGTAMRVGLVSYSDTAKVERQITGNRDQLLAAIKAIAAPNGATNTADALTKAKAELIARGRPGACKSIKLLTDGKSTNPAATLAAAQDIKATTNWTVVVIGIGGADKAEMDAIATPPLATNSLFLAATDLDDLAHTLATKCDNCVINPDACIAVVDCVVSDFAAWSDCSSPCGGGQQTRKRTVIIWPGPGGKACPALEETQACNTQSCAIDCVVSDWGAWGACSANCGGGIRKRSRTILVAAQNGGAACPALEESEACNTNYCPVDCVVSSWSAWGACSAPCNGGTQTRTRTVTVAPLHGGVPCPPLTESQACNTVVCPPTCEFTPWTDWGACDKTCGGGIQTRTRAPIPKDPAHCHCDIMLVLDRSGSIGTANWAKMVAFAMSLVNGFTFTNEFGMRLGITTFADNAKLECGMSFDKAALTACVNNMVYTRGSTQTHTGIATGFAELEAKKQPNKCRSMKIVTDGQATSKPIDLLWTEVAKVKAASIDIYALGVDVSGGTDPVTVAAMTAQLQKMASDPVAEHYQMLSNFDALDAVAKQLTGTCDQYTGVNGQTNPCPTNTVETQPCNLQPCPVDCVLGAWSTWTTCSLNCGGGTQTRSRIIEVQAQNGGVACPAASALTETQPCNTQDCAVDCVVGPWGSWSACTLPCGGGKQRRERNVLQAAANGGKDCPALTEEQDCNTQACPVDCIVTDWDPWTACDKPCGSGVRHRERMVLQQAANGGLPCPALKQTEACNTQECPIDCLPGPWSDWSRCSKDCGLGTQTRTRSVVTPAQFGGLPCLPGDLIQTQECNPQPCPVDCVVGPYGDWGNCSVPCGGGTQMRERQITTIPANGGAPCPATQESRACNQQECVTDCVVSAWSVWSPCSRACGTGTWTRTRTIITQPTGGAVCPPLNETQTCNDQPCPVNCVVGPWSDWGACSLSCGGGTQLATRQVLVQPQFGGAACPQDLQKTQPCNTQPCPVDCVLSDWSAWGACTVPCGSGTQTRIRTVTTAAANGGAPCPTSLSENRPCNDQPCAIDCVVSDWGTWSTCTLNCGGGQQTRTRTVITQANFGGVPCPPLVESQGCNTQPCAVDCVVSTWGAWTPCSLSCGKGYTRRTRTVVTPAANGGAVCPALEETMDCNDFPCPINCVVSAWSAWGPCSVPCGGGEATRTRTITTQPAYGGVACPQLSEHQPCNDQACPDVACVVSDWGEWSACSVECGGGVQTRTRSVRPLQLASGSLGSCPKTEQTKSCNSHACPVAGAQSSVVVA